MTEYKPKLIEVALPLDAINKASSREKGIFYGHPSTLHLWWSRKPLAACRAVLWASLVDDPSANPDQFPTEEAQAAERERLFRILERLVVWENSNNSDVLAEAHAEVAHCFDGNPPAVLDPFAGGGSIPLEAQRLGLRVLAGDLNPVAVLINKSMLEIPPRFAGCPPVHPDAKTELGAWGRAQGLAADIRAYGAWMREEAERRIGHLYPDAVGPNGKRLTPIAWMWGRTVRSPDPAWGRHVPLVASWVLRNKAGKSKVWVEPIIDREAKTISYRVREGGDPTFERTVNRGNGTCIATGAAIPLDYTKAEWHAGGMGAHLMAVAAEGSRGRQYCEGSSADVTACQEAVKLSESVWKPVEALPPKGKGLGFTVQAYGLEEWWQLFTERQLVALTTFSDLLDDIHAKVLADGIDAGLVAKEERLRDGGAGAVAYADAVVTYLAFAVDKCADYWSRLCTWDKAGEKMRNTFPRQVVTMVWDYCEANPFSSSTANWMSMVNRVAKSVESLPATREGIVRQMDARAFVGDNSNLVISTDPPYYNNIGYSDISNFFYVWLKRNLSEIWPSECSTLLTPKIDELISDPSRHKNKAEADDYFESGMAEFMGEVVEGQCAELPATIYYAYKATETTEDGGLRSTGWDTFLQAVVSAGLQVTATWPLRTERATRARSLGSNALASSIVLACRPRSTSAVLVSRSDFVAALRSELPEAIRVLQSGNIAPVDLSQSTIGPGIKVFSRYAKVVEADGSTMPVSDALAIINEVLDDVLYGEESELDAETRFALAWYAQHGFEIGPFGEADSIARAKGTAVEGVVRAGVGESSGGKFRLFRRGELDPDWDPASDSRLVAWEALQHLAARLEQSESGAARLLARLGGVGDSARQLSYLLHKIASDKRWAEEARVYNGLISAWPMLRASAPKVESPKLINN